MAQFLNERLQPVRQCRIPIRHNPRSHESAKSSAAKLTNRLIRQSSASTTLAELFRLYSDPHSAVGTSFIDLLWRERVDDGASDSWQGLVAAAARMDSFSRLRPALETLMLQEGVGDHGHERVPMQALP